MAERVKNTKPTYRQQQAEATKLRIAEAARLLFAARGYGATSMEAIAAEAGVGARTVYAVFGSKREILNCICERWLDQSGATPLAKRILSLVDPLERIHGAARWLTTLYATDFEVVRILDAAMDEDAETRKLLHSKLKGRNRVMDSLISSVKRELEIDLEDARAIFRAFAAAGVYGELVAESGWTPARFEHWLATTLVTQLMPGHR